MDCHIERYAAEPLGADLMLCAANGVAYQRDMKAGRVEYGEEYLAKVDAYEGTPIARAVNAGRCAMLKRHLMRGDAVLDIGAGSGDFVAAANGAGIYTRGFDINPAAAERLRRNGLYAEWSHWFHAMTLWDTLEHMEEPAAVLRQVSCGDLVFVSVPVFRDLHEIRQSKHYRPGEHLYYWTRQGFVDWMRGHGFAGLEVSQHEIAAGRDSILAFAFRRMQ